MKRGIIAASGIIELKIGGGMVATCGLSAEDIRFFLLYWDKIIIPQNNILDFEVPDVDDLMSCGVVWRPICQHIGNISNVGEAILRGQTEIAQMMMKDKNADWVIHQSGNQFYIPEGFATTRNVIRMDLVGALPVPGKDVKINEILEFKEKRYDELKALHNSLDEIYIEILKSPDSDLSKLKSLDRLKKDIENLNVVSNESYRVDRKFDLSTEFNVAGKDVVLAAAGGICIDNVMAATSFPVATVLAVIASTLKISLKASKTFSYIGERSKLGYLSRATKEKILG